MLYWEVLMKSDGKLEERTYAIGPESDHHCCGSITSATVNDWQKCGSV